MSRKKDDKRDLISPRDNRQKRSKRQRIRRNNRNPPMKSSRRNHPPHKRSGITVFLMILALVAFVIGAGMGIALSFDDGSDDEPHIENVTKEMTTNLNDTEPIYFDEDLDAVDFNDNQTLEEFNVTDDAPSY